jgi:hypothetical protein
MRTPPKISKRPIHLIVPAYTITGEGCFSIYEQQIAREKDAPMRAVAFALVGVV